MRTANGKYKSHRCFLSAYQVASAMLSASDPVVRPVASGLSAGLWRTAGITGKKKGGNGGRRNYILF